jgi:hypothetical protein
MAFSINRSPALCAGRDECLWAHERICGVIARRKGAQLMSQQASELQAQREVTLMKEINVSVRLPEKFRSLR